MISLITATFKFKSVKVFNYVLPKLLQSLKSFFKDSRVSFVKEAVIRFIVVNVTVELSLLPYTFLSYENKIEIFIIPTS